jgi:hypothetical protein
VDAVQADARQRRDQWLEKQRKRGDVDGTSDVLWDVYVAALAGLDCVFKGERGAAAKLSYVVRRVEQHNVHQAATEPRPTSEAFRELRKVIADED